MTEESPPKSLEDWSALIRQSKVNWLAFYNEMLGVRASSIPRLYRAANLYGFFPLFEAIVDSATRGLTGDPLPYVLKVAANKWREEQEQKNEASDYANALEQAKEASRKANQDLAKRIKRRKK